MNRMLKLSRIAAIFGAILVLAACGRHEPPPSAGEPTLSTGSRTGVPLGSEGATASDAAAQTEESWLSVTTAEEHAETPVIGHFQWNPYAFDLLGGDCRSSAQRLAEAILAYEPSVMLESGQAAVVCDNFAFEFPPAALVDFTLHGDEVAITYLYDRQTHDEKLAAFKQSVETVLNSTVSEQDSEKVRALLLYGYVADHVSYFTVDYTEKQITAFSALTDHVTICYGYADAFAYLLRQTGMEAHVYRGSRWDGAEHGWCYAKVDGSFYHFDPTWECSSQKNSGRRSLLYFGMNDETRFGGLTQSCVWGFGELERPGDRTAAPQMLLPTQFFPCYNWRYDRQNGKVYCDMGEIKF